MSVQPIKPDEIPERIPEEIIAAFNELIKKHFSNGSATFKQNEVLAILEAKGFNRAEIFGKHWLDVEPLFEDNWNIKYESPSYGDTDFEAYFVFEQKKKSRKK